MVVHYIFYKFIHTFNTNLKEVLRLNNRMRYPFNNNYRLTSAAAKSKAIPATRYPVT